MTENCSTIDVKSLSDEILLELMQHWGSEYGAYVLLIFIFGQNSFQKSELDLVLNKYNLYLGECNVRNLI